MRKILNNYGVFIAVVVMTALAVFVLSVQKPALQKAETGCKILLLPNSNNNFTYIPVCK